MIAPTAHSSVVGGSTAARILNCPGSIALIAKLPKAIDVGSEYAQEGSDLHTVIAGMIYDDKPMPIVGTVVGTTIITDDLINHCLVPCLEFWGSLFAPDGTIGGGDAEFDVEVAAQFPGVKDAFGTCDAVARSESLNRVHIVDWKFGQGVSVSATYPDPDDEDYELVNEQLLFYACCLRAHYPDWFDADTDIHMSIVQPRNQDEDKRVSTTSVKPADLDAFQADIARAIGIAAKAAAPMKIGPWCRFAACKPDCPLHNAPLLDLSAITEIATPAKRDDSEYALRLASILSLAPLAEALIAEANRQAHDMLTAGFAVPGFKLVAKRPTRSWNQTEEETVKLLRKRFKLVKAKVYEPVLKSPAQIEKLLPKGTKVPIELAAPISSGTTLVPDNDKRVAVDPPNASLKGLLELSLANAKTDE